MIKESLRPFVFPGLCFFLSLFALKGGLCDPPSEAPCVFQLLAADDEDRVRKLAEKLREDGCDVRVRDENEVLERVKTGGECGGYSDEGFALVAGEIRLFEELYRSRFKVRIVPASEGEGVAARIAGKYGLKAFRIGEPRLAIEDFVERFFLYEEVEDSPDATRKLDADIEYLKALYESVKDSIFGDRILFLLGKRYSLGGYVDLLRGEGESFDTAVSIFERILARYPESGIKDRAFHGICLFYDRYLTTKEAMDKYGEFEKKFPGSPLIGEVERRLAELRSMGEEERKEMLKDKARSWSCCEIMTRRDALTAVKVMQEYIDSCPDMEKYDYTDRQILGELLLRRYRMGDHSVRREMSELLGKGKMPAMTRDEIKEILSRSED